ncbi:cytochrome c biogenesis protein [Bacillus sp. RG28]|uniref:Cytochrome c biogenesis protein n=1 Tax=Gottfriedia endophytica TaxID=2820819 RepID=A0A940NP11_9BACI|nr:cytochrome c biogenesis protein ResB [Gottfriedia endophytica]MBP0724256.1 cytochrome c biogenesis protein [Gottfriedia endophytica]
MENFKCECGHMNPIGTVICESCGKPQDENSNLLDMKYEGTARRSIVKNKTIIDKIWNFFSSVKIAIVIILITLIASALGTIFPQRDLLPPTANPDTFYKDNYGIFGQIYDWLGLDNTFQSWWFMLLISSIGVSLVICSLDRIIPLYRALKNQRVTRHPNFLKRQRLFNISSVTNEEEQLKVVKERLEKKKYKVREENGNLLAEKGRFSRWGPYVNHIGLIIFLFGVLLRYVPGMYMDKAMWVQEGQTKEVPGSNGSYYVQLHKFIFETYDVKTENKIFRKSIERIGNDRIPKNYQANVTLYKRVGNPIPGVDPKLKKVKDYSIKVNEPLQFNGISLYQVDYRLNEMTAFSFDLMNKKTGELFGPIKVDLLNPKAIYQIKPGYKIELKSYFPDFYFNKAGEPDTRTKNPNNPAFVFKMTTPETPQGEVAFVAIKQNIEPNGQNKYKMAFAGLETKNSTGLSVNKDYTLWVLSIGGAIFMIGLIQGMYWYHRRIWIQRQNGEIWVAGFTNKNYYGFKQELKKIFNDTDILMPEDQVLAKNSIKTGGEHVSN